jgi:hypothetical protein
MLNIDVERERGRNQTHLSSQNFRSIPGLSDRSTFFVQYWMGIGVKVSPFGRDKSPRVIAAQELNHLGTLLPTVYAQIVAA